MSAAGPAPAETKKKASSRQPAQTEETLNQLGLLKSKLIELSKSEGQDVIFLDKNRKPTSLETIFAKKNFEPFYIETDGYVYGYNAKMNGENVQTSIGAFEGKK